MPRRKKPRSEFEDTLQRYANTRYHDLKRYAGSHTRYSIIDPGYYRVDIWPDRRYHIVYARCWRVTQSGKIDYRKGERGVLPEDRVELGRFLDHIFFDADILEERRLAKDAKN